MPASSSSAVAACIRSRSDSEPTRMPTTGASATCNVRPEAHAGEIYARRGVVGRGSGRLDGGADADDVEDPPAIRHEPPVVERCPRVEDERAGRLGVLDPVDRRAAVAALGVLTACDHDSDGGAICDLRLVREVAGEERQQVALEPGKERLRLRVTEAAVELDHP